MGKGLTEQYLLAPCRNSRKVTYYDYRHVAHEDAGCETPWMVAFVLMVVACFITTMISGCSFLEDAKGQDGHGGEHSCGDGKHSGANPGVPAQRLVEVEEGTVGVPLH